MRKERVGFAMCGSFCTHEKVLAELEKLVQLYETVIPIASEISAFTDTRFGTSDDLMERLEDLTGHEVLCDIPSVEPIGPKGRRASHIRRLRWRPRPICGTGGRW